METTYRKVLVKDRLPKENNTYFTGWDNEGRTIILGSNYFNGKIFEDDEDSDKYAQPDWWLEATRTLTRNRGGANNESNYLAELFAFVLRYCGSTG